jgi:hypothetical protein
MREEHYLKMYENKVHNKILLFGPFVLEVMNFHIMLSEISRLPHTVIL